MTKASGKLKRVDWASAKAWFMADHTRTLGDVAEYFKVNASTIRYRAGVEKWVDSRAEMATITQKKATERLQEEHIDKAARCNDETIMIARAIRQKVASFLKKENLTASELSSVATSHEKAVIQERLALGMATSSSEITGKNGESLVPTSGVLLVPSALDAESWEKAVSEHQNIDTDKSLN